MQYLIRKNKINNWYTGVAEFIRTLPFRLSYQLTSQCTSPLFYMLNFFIKLNYYKCYVIYVMYLYSELRRGHIHQRINMG